MTPYWVDRLGKSKLVARQLSARGGEVICIMQGDRVLLEGQAVKYLEGKIEIPL
jgi:predicted PhzF superfamily epimerase YddE/YHI9